MPLPVRSGYITAVFGPTSEPLDSGGFNKGVDIGVPVGTPFEFVVGGTVVHAGPAEDGWGISVKVRDANGIIHNYGHLSEVSVAVGDEVVAGQTGGFTGNSGASTGPHLSYDTYTLDGTGVDPSPYLGFNAIGDNRQPELTVIGKSVNELGEGGGSVEDARYWEKRRRYSELSAQYGLWIEDPDLARTLGLPKPTPEIVQELLTLDGELAEYEDTYGVGGVSVGDIKNAYDIYNSTDPRVIDAANAAARYDRDYATRVDAANDANTRLREQLDLVKEATDSQQAFIDSAAGGAPRLAGAVALPAKLKTGEELFSESLAKLTKNLPAVPDYPYPVRPAGGPEDILRRTTSGGLPPMPPTPTYTPVPTGGPAPMTIASPGLPSRDAFFQPPGVGPLVTLNRGGAGATSQPGTINGSIYNRVGSRAPGVR